MRPSDEEGDTVGEGDYVAVFYGRLIPTWIKIQEEDGDFLFGVVNTVRNGHLSYGRRVRLPRSRIVEIREGRTSERLKAPLEDFPSPWETDE